MSIQIRKPTSLLSPWVKHFWAIQSHRPDGGEHVQRIVPSGLMELSFYLSQRPSLTSGPLERIPGHVVVTGHQQSYHDIRIGKTLDLFSVTFTPIGAAILLDVPLNEFLNRHISLDLVLYAFTRELEEKIRETRSFDRRVRILEDILLQRLYQNNGWDMKDRIMDSIHLINMRKSMISPDELADRACLSRRQYERQFLRHVGITAKQFLKTVRFQYAIFTRKAIPGRKDTEIAYHCGYYDQSHMIHDFIQLSGLTPGELFSDCDLHSDYFS